MEPRYQCLSIGPGWSWRLLGSNHRALARSLGQFPTMDAAAADALDIGLNAAQAQIDVLYGSAATWRWQLVLGGAARASSAVPYARRLECVRAVTRFRECAGLAEVSAAPLIRRSGSGRSWRGGTGPAGAAESGNGHRRDTPYAG